MAQMIDLRDLLKHEILDLYSAEEQIIEALPKMVEKANNAQLKNALRDHLKVTEQQKKRLDEVKNLMGENEEGSEQKGFFSRIFGGSGGEKCKGTEGLITEGEKMMGEDMSPEVMDAAIIGSAQKIEHYEICGYGTAVAYARELGLSNVAGLLQQTLDEEYEADDLLTTLAVGKLNVDAENADSLEGRSRRSSSKASSSDKGASKGSAAKGSSKGNASKGASKSASKASPSKSGSKSASKNNSSRGASKGAASKDAASKGSSSRSNTSKSSKSSGNKGAAKSSSSKSASKGGGRNSSKGSNKSGKSKSGRR